MNNSVPHASGRSRSSHHWSRSWSFGEEEEVAEEGVLSNDGSRHLYCSQKCFRKQLPKSCYWKLLPEVPCKCVSESCCSAKKVFLKAVLESCPKLLPKAVPRRCSPKLFHKAAVQSYGPKAAILQIYTPKWLPESCSPKWFVKLPPKAAPQSCCSSK